MKLAAVISMHDERGTVYETIKTLQENGVEDIALVHSVDSKDCVKIPSAGVQYIPLDNLGDQYSRWEVPARSLCRNFEAGTRCLWRKYAARDMSEIPNHIIYLTGDTLISNMNGINHVLEMYPDYWLYCTRAINQNFHGAHLTLEQLQAGGGGGRYQHKEITADFMPQFFILEWGELFLAFRMFCDIEVTNRWCSEQCLGDAYRKAMEMGSWKQQQLTLAPVAYPDIDGIQYHTRL